MNFSADWLDLREPFDRRARNPAILQQVATALAERPFVTIVDLACGTGSTLRALAPHLPLHQTWRLFDNDLSLLARVPPAANVQVVALDLARDLEAALDGPVDLVTTSALLDLVSDAWLERLAVEVAARRIPVYVALTYDGRVDLSPMDPQHAAIIAAVNAHQRRDKGFGPALGPSAVSAAVSCFERVGYVVGQGTADWIIHQDDCEMQNAILSGWAIAARETGALSLEAVAEWLQRRRAAVAAGTSTIRIGHVDLFASPNAR
jgi:hypothetical protein